MYYYINYIYILYKLYICIVKQPSSINYEKMLTAKDNEVSKLKSQIEHIKKVSILNGNDAAAYKAEVSLLRSELDGKAKEQAGHNSEVWKIPPKRTALKQRIIIGIGGWGEVLKGTVEVAMKRINHPDIVIPKTRSVHWSSV